MRSRRLAARMDERQPSVVPHDLKAVARVNRQEVESCDRSSPSRQRQWHIVVPANA
jgi:hypothetical protein